MLGTIEPKSNGYSINLDKYSPQYPVSASQSKDETQKAQGNFDQSKEVRPGYKVAKSECSTCKNRKYQDGSNESDVSFQTPGHISPESSASVVRAHEMQHVANAYQVEATGKGEVKSVSVTLHTSVCPECGTAFVSGGTTQTAIAYPVDDSAFTANRKSFDKVALAGANLDYRI